MAGLCFNLLGALLEVESEFQSTGGTFRSFAMICHHQRSPHCQVDFAKQFEDSITAVQASAR